MVRREGAVAEGRAAVVSAARRLLARSGFHRLGLAEVAAEAGLTRATVYNQFGSKLGLLEAVLDDVARRGDAARIAAAAAIPDASRALGAVIGETCRFWASDRAILRRLLGLAAVDPEVSGAIEAREKRRRRSVLAVGRRLAVAGRIRPGTTEAEAVAALMVLCSFESFDRLVAEGVREPARAAALLLGLAGSVIDLGPA